MRKTILATFLALIMGSLHGFYGAPNDCCVPTSCCEQTSCCDFLQGLEFDAEFLWWKGQAEGFFIEVTENTSGITPAPFTFNDSYWNLGYAPGFRLGLSYLPSQWNDVALYATFTHFRTTDTQRLALAGTTTTSFFVELPFLTVTLGDGETLDYTGDADFLYNRFDLGFAKYCYKFGCLNVVPKAAFTYIHTRTSLSEDYFISDTDIIAGVFTKDSYSGYGATIGFDTNYDFWAGSGFSFFSSLGLSGLWGPYTIDFHENDVVGTTGILTGVGSQNQTHYFGRWMSDIQVGFQYQSCLCGCYQVAARIGWEFLYLADELDFQRLRDPSAMKINGLTVGLAVGF